MTQQIFPISTLTDRLVAEHARGPQSRATARRGLAATLGLWLARSRQRRHLRELADWDERLLQDIGVSREAALREAAKAFWQK